MRSDAHTSIKVVRIVDDVVYLGLEIENTSATKHSWCGLLLKPSAPVRLHRTQRVWSLRRWGDPH